MKTISALAALLLLAGCGGSFGEEAGQAKNKSAQQKGLKVNPPAGKKVNQPVEEAMARIPPKLRQDFQAALACEVKRNKGKGLQITADYVTSLTARLQADPGLAKC